jgi:hypothetical protein
MFFYPRVAPDAGPVTILINPVRKWSDGTLADYGAMGRTREAHQH